MSWIKNEFGFEWVNDILKSERIENRTDEPTSHPPKT